MTTGTIDTWIIRGVALFSLGVLGTVVATGIPLFLIPDEREDWTGSDAAAALYASVQVQNSLTSIQHLGAIQISVVDIEPDPTGCDWGYGRPVASIVTVKTYTFFGLPTSTWTVDCHGPNRP